MDIMIDIETLGTKPGCVIASIAAVQFDPVAGKLGSEHYWQLDVQRQISSGAHCEWSTFRWWLDQPKEAIESTFARMKEGLFDGTALQELADVIHDASFQREPGAIWANSPSFDLAILEGAFRDHNIEVPWGYRQPRDCRTAFAMTGFDFKAFIKTHDTVAHNALCDARLQALGVIEAYKRVK